MPSPTAIPDIFPKVCNIAVYPPGATFGPRRLRDYELVWIIEGDARYHTRQADGAETTHDAPAGSMVLCRPGVIDSFFWDPNRPTRHAFVHFDISAPPRHWPPERDWPVLRKLEPDDILRPMFRHLLAWMQADPLVSELTLCHMLAVFITGQLTTAQLTPGRLPEPVERAIRYLYKRLDNDASRPIEFHDLVRASGVTAPHLCRLFKKTTGRTPAQTIKLARLDRAASMLFHSSYSIKEIASLCGFSTPFLFSRQFKQAYGIAPAYLRHQIEQGQSPPLARLHVRPILINNRYAWENPSHVHNLILDQ